VSLVNPFVSFPAAGGSPTVTVVQDDIDAGTATSRSIVFPSSPTEGNLLVAAIVSRNPAVTQASSSGWTGIQLAAAAEIAGGLWWKVAGASEGTTHGFTLSSSVGALVVAAELDLNGYTIGSVTSGSQAAVTASPTTPSRTYTAPALIIAGFATAENQALSSPTNGFTIARASTAAAATGGAAVTFKVDDVGGSVSTGMTVAVSDDSVSLIAGWTLS
jgi:hypothetical protein